MLIISLAVRSRSHHAIIYHMKHITPASLKSYQSYFDGDARNQVLQRAVMVVIIAYLAGIALTAPQIFEAWFKALNEFSNGV